MWTLPITILAATTLLAIPLSKYLAWIMNGKYRAPAILRWFEARVNGGPQNWIQYTLSMLIFNTVLFLFGFAILSLQPLMPLNDLHRGMLEPTTIFHSVISFMTNTDLQHYSGDQAFSNFSQIFFGIANFFLSASIGFCGLTAIIRAAKRPQCREFLSRYVASRDVYVSALRFCAKPGVLAARQSDDALVRQNRFDARAGLDGHDRQRRG